MRHALALALLAGSALVAAQATPPGGLAFEVASVKPNRGGSTSWGSDDRIPSRYSATNVTLRTLISSAYGLNPIRDGARIIGPAWIGQDRFDVIDRVEPPTPD